ncbi:DNA cytosine methyltransferase [Dactylosporangium fulvum]|uniref:DNA (cytosine-5-)-methyltransferase n=1 Tax=Dactylosporangium fulvum TaxID=53359 RepID=A0ABY5W3E8_9ACTN|nr:DNA (cytosine-5-)-methyltransferase [Dactylosporangium fulvum]UWP83910.1 DNA (cytosine-5-)-methyltransferase [Dactylosporangium fulvum]
MAGLFAGIGGIETGLRRAAGDQMETVMLCESWTPAQQVLEAHFPDVELQPDVASLSCLPERLDLVAAGFPCTDLSQAGRTAGIRGAQSGLVAHLFDVLRLADQRGDRLPWLLIENVPNMLTLDRGEAMAYLVKELGHLGYRWAYRVVDSRFTGVPQRRRRVLLLASRTEDPRAVLFADDTPGLDESSLRDDAFGFYWTEGRGGLGWARDATPTFKGGSTVGIPSPPAVWLPSSEPGRKIVVPCVEDGEALQGFDRGWTAAADLGRRNGPRWKLVGNAVTVGVAQWVGERILTPGVFDGESIPWIRKGGWPTAAWGDGDAVWKVELTEFPRLEPYTHLLELLDVDNARPLSHRAANGFWSRLQEGNLGRHSGFRADIAEHVEVASTATLPPPPGRE